MSTISGASDTARVGSRQMPRKPTKPSKDEGLVKVTLMLPNEDVASIDEEANRLTRDDPYGRTVTRTDVIRSYIKGGLSKRDGRR